MKINAYLLRLATAMIIIFGGAFTIRYFRSGELLVDQLIGASIGMLLLIAVLIWRKINAIR